MKRAKTETVFERHALADERICSAVALVKLLLQQNSEILIEHRREFLRLALWKVTEAEWPHKHKTRYRSKAALSANKELRHDHVFQRADMADKLLEPNADVDKILNDAVGCTITHNEHVWLNKFKEFDGWDRYKHAGIDVIDTETNTLFEFPPSD